MFTNENRILVSLNFPMRTLSAVSVTTAGKIIWRRLSLLRVYNRYLLNFRRIFAFPGFGLRNSFIVMLPEMIIG